uniref:Uncharacterized protein n=1 Tax=Gossypium raimondii TaxID=29730 RepID=A0A0D2SKG3_GOSRA|nr:hypothetical protein B456_007G268000 [Gossypium raimondii]
MKDLYFPKSFNLLLLLSTVVSFLSILISWTFPLHCSTDDIRNRPNQLLCWYGLLILKPKSPLPHLEQSNLKQILHVADRKLHQRRLTHSFFFLQFSDHHFLPNYQSP